MGTKRGTMNGALYQEYLEETEMPALLGGLMDRVENARRGAFRSKGYLVGWYQQTMAPAMDGLSLDALGWVRETVRDYRGVVQADVDFFKELRLAVDWAGRYHVEDFPEARGVLEDRYGGLLARCTDGEELLGDLDRILREMDRAVALRVSMGCGDPKLEEQPETVDGAVFPYSRLEGALTAARDECREALRELDLDGQDRLSDYTASYLQELEERLEMLRLTGELLMNSAGEELERVRGELELR